MASKQLMALMSKCIKIKFSFYLGIMELVKPLQLVYSQAYLTRQQVGQSFLAWIFTKNKPNFARLWVSAHNMMFLKNYWRVRSISHCSMKLRVPILTQKSKMQRF